MFIMTLNFNTNHLLFQYFLVFFVRTNRIFIRLLKKQKTLQLSSCLIDESCSIFRGKIHSLLFLVLGDQGNNGNDGKCCQNQHDEEGQLHKHGSDAQDRAATASDDQKQFFTHDTYLLIGSENSGGLYSAILSQGSCGSQRVFPCIQDIIGQTFWETSVFDKAIRSFESNFPAVCQTSSSSGKGTSRTCGQPCASQPAGDRKRRSSAYKVTPKAAF